MIDPMQQITQQFADLDGRVRALEGGQRSGLSNVALSSGTAGYTISSFGLDNWQDNAGVTTPQVTLETGSRVLIMATWRPTGIGSPGASIGVTDFRSLSAVMGIQIDSTEPQDWPLPPLRSQVAINSYPGGDIWIPASIISFRDDLTPGEHTFTMRFYAFDSYPAGTVNPTATDTFLVVIPLGYS